MNTFVVAGSGDIPIRVSYHGNVHYNAIVDPNNPAFGLGLGLPDLTPGVSGAILNTWVVWRTAYCMFHTKFLSEIFYSYVCA